MDKDMNEAERKWESTRCTDYPPGQSCVENDGTGLWCDACIERTACDECGETVDPKARWRNGETGREGHRACVEADRRNSLQRAYDAAVDPDGWPTMRVGDTLRQHPGLAEEALGVANDMVDRPDGDDVDPRDAFLAGFTTGLMWVEDNDG